MARLLLLAFLVGSAFGCDTFDKYDKWSDSQEKNLADSADQAALEDFELRNGGPKKSEERPKTESTIAEKPISPDQQIRLRIMIAEVDRPDICVLGFGLSRKEGDNRTKLPWVLDNGEVRFAIKPGLEKRNSACVLAEDTLVVQNGREATALFGGSFTSVAHVSGLWSIPFGVQAKLTPTLTEGNRIDLKMCYEIAIRDPSVQYSSGFGLNTRHLNTTIEMTNGQTFAVAGLIDNTFWKESCESSLLDSIPFFKKEPDPRMIPRELVLVITPEIVQASEKKKE